MMDEATEEAEERMRHLERDLEEPIETEIRAKIIVIYANFIRFSETILSSPTLENRNEFFREYCEFRLGVQKLIGHKRMENLLGTDSELDEMYGSEVNLL